MATALRSAMRATPLRQVQSELPFSVWAYLPQHECSYLLVS
jgi:hypothetical protein